MDKKKKIDWFSITLREFRVIDRIQREHPEDSASHIAKFIYGNDELEFLPVPEYLSLIGDLAFLGEPIPKAPIKMKYKINGRSYSLDLNAGNLSAAQFIDAQNYINDNAPVESLLTVYLIPEGKRYNEGYCVDEVREDILSLPMPEVVAITSFFQKWVGRFVGIFQRYLRRQIRKAKIPKEEEKRIMSMMEEAVKSLHLGFCLTS